MVLSRLNSLTENNFKATRTQKVIVLLVIFFISVVYFGFQLFMPLRIFDEGIILTGADRVVNGAVPYKDFWSIYPPGNFFLLSFWFELFGTSVLTERIYGIMINACLSTALVVILYKCRIRITYILTGYFLSLLIIGAIKLPTYPVFPALLFIYISTIFFIAYLKTGQTVSLVLAGVFITVGSLFRHELAGFACISFVIGLIYMAFRSDQVKTKHGLIFLLAVLLAGLPFLLYFSYVIGFDNLYVHLIKTPAMIMPNFRWLPYPTSFSFITVLFYLVPLTLVAGVLTAIIALKQNRKIEPVHVVVLLFSVMGLFFMLQTMVRSDLTHLTPPALMAIPTAALLMNHLQNSLKGPLLKNTPQMVMIICAMIVFIACLQNYLHVPVKKPNNEHLNRIKFAHVPNELMQTLLFIKDHTAPADYIFVGVENHDQFILNDTALYFLAARNYGTKYHEFSPGIVTTQPVQEEIVAELKKNNVKLIILAPRHWYEPNQSNIDHKIDILDQYIQNNYTPIKQFGSYQILLLNTAEATYDLS